VSRWTRASFASSILALSLVAAGCGGARYDAADVQRAFPLDERAVVRLGSLSDDRPAPMQPLNAIRRWFASLLTGAPAVPPLPELAIPIGDGDEYVGVYADEADAGRAVRAFEWYAEHVDELRAAAARAGADPSELAGAEDGRIARRGNVVVVYPASAERRVRAALGRLD
jgi:hypothetical protein